jgi:hypothetical protein
MYMRAIVLGLNKSHMAVGDRILVFLVNTSPNKEIYQETAHFLRLQRLHDSWGLSLRRLGGGRALSFPRPSSSKIGGISSAMELSCLS